MKRKTWSSRVMACKLNRKRIDNIRRDLEKLLKKTAIEISRKENPGIKDPFVKIEEAFVKIEILIDVSRDGCQYCDLVAELTIGDAGELMFQAHSHEAVHVPCVWAFNKIVEKYGVT